MVCRDQLPLSRNVTVSFQTPRSVQNAAYRLALLASIGGLVLLMVAGSGDDFRTPLGVALLAVAGLLIGLGKAIDVLGYVKEGAADTEDPP